MAEKSKKKADPCTITLKNVILSFEHVFVAKKPKPDKDGKVGAPTFSASGLMEKGTEQTKENLAVWKKAKRLASIKKWGEDETKWPKLKPEKIAVRDGDLEDYEGYPKHWYLSSRSPEDEPPLVVGYGKQDITKKDGLIYSGSIVNLLVNVWAQDNDFGKRINAKLLGVQFVSKGTPFGNAGPVNRDEAFEDISEDAPVDEIGDETGEEDDDGPI